MDERPEDVAADEDRPDDLEAEPDEGPDDTTTESDQAAGVEAPPATAPPPAPPVPGDPVERLHARVDPLAQEVERLEQSVTRAGQDERSAAGQSEEARKRLAELEETHARALADSYREGGDADAAQDARAALEDARRSVERAEGERSQAARAGELLRGDLEEARRRLRDEAAEAKREAAEAIVADASEPWREVRSRLDRLTAVAEVPHGQNPGVVTSAGPGADAFERAVLQGQGLRPGPGPAATVARLVLRVLLTVAGGGAMVFGAVLEWIRPLHTNGVDLDYRAFYDLEAIAHPLPNAVSAGAIVIGLGLLGILGLAFRSGWVTRAAGILGTAGLVMFAVTLSRAGHAIPDAVGLGAWMALGGGLVTLAGGFSTVRRRSP